METNDAKAITPVETVLSVFLHLAYLQMNMITEAVILGNGDYPSHAYPLNVLSQAPYVVCCDGAADEYIRRGFRPDAIIGDGDSLSPENRERFAGIFHHVKDQETNDQTKAVRFLQTQGKRQIAIVGATGKREDHTLGNISLLMDYMQEGLQVQMMTDHGIFIPACNTQVFTSQPRQQISIFNFGATGLQGEGLAYPLSDFNNWWQGTLNETTGSEFRIHATGKYLVFICFPHGEI